MTAGTVPAAEPVALKVQSNLSKQRPAVERPSRYQPNVKTPGRISPPVIRANLRLETPAGGVVS